MGADSDSRSTLSGGSDCAPPEGQDAAIAQYRALSASAVVALVFGLLAPAAMIDPLLWAVPALGILLGCTALWRIARNPLVLVGRKAALAGLALSIFFGAVAPADWFAYREMVRREARQFGQAWFDYLADGQPHMANQLTIHPKYRQPLDDRLWAFYGEAPRWRAKLEEYVREPLVRTLLALRHNAQVRYYETSGEKHTAREDVLWVLYAVTFDDNGAKKTFFVGLQLQRHKLDDGRANWQVVQLKSKVKPGIGN